MRSLCGGCKTDQLYGTRRLCKVDARAEQTSGKMRERCRVIRQIDTEGHIQKLQLF